MSKHWKPGRQTVALKPSRIRRDPVRIDPKPRQRQTPVNTREREMRDGVTGVLLVAGALAVATVGISALTFLRDDPGAAARNARFGQCYNSGSNCVVDGETIYVAGEKVRIAGIDAPQIQGAACADERNRGVEAAIQLAALLNTGPVTVSGAGPAKTVEVGDRDVAEAMIAHSLARRAGDETVNWCGSSE